MKIFIMILGFKLILLCYFDFIKKTQENEFEARQKFFFEIICRQIMFYVPLG